MQDLALTELVGGLAAEIYSKSLGAGDGADADIEWLPSIHRCAVGFVTVISLSRISRFLTRLTNKNTAGPAFSHAKNPLKCSQKRIFSENTGNTVRRYVVDATHERARPAAGRQAAAALKIAASVLQ